MKFEELEAKAVSLLTTVESGPDLSSEKVLRMAEVYARLANARARWEKKRTHEEEPDHR